MEIQILFGLFQRYLLSEQQNLLREDIRVSAFGRRDRFPAPVREALAVAEDSTRSCKRMHLRIALDYGSRHEIAEAVRSLAGEIEQKKLKPGEITEECISRRLYGAAVPDPDLIIRTAGEQRLSNFLLWQAAYSELYFCPELWPDFDADDLDRALACYRSRTRKFGALACATGTAG